MNDKGKIVHTYFYEGYKNRVNFSELYLQLQNDFLSIPEDSNSAVSE